MAKTCIADSHGTGVRPAKVTFYPFEVHYRLLILLQMLLLLAQGCLFLWRHFGVADARDAVCQWSNGIFESQLHNWFSVNSLVYADLYLHTPLLGFSHKNSRAPPHQTKDLGNELRLHIKRVLLFSFFVYFLAGFMFPDSCNTNSCLA